MINISACIIFSKEDERFLELCQASLPAGIEICAVQCLEGAAGVSQFRHLQEREHDNGTMVRQAMWQFPRGGFRFDMARNKCLSLASREWILAIDADERLIQHQWPDWVQATEEAPANVGGIAVGVFGSVSKGHGFSRHNGSQVRLFRNLPQIYYRKRVHEHFGLRETIDETGMETIDSTLNVHHVGYETDKPRLLAKVRRNLALTYKELAANPAQPDIEAKLLDTLQMQHELTG